MTSVSKLFEPSPSPSFQDDTEAEDILQAKSLYRGKQGQPDPRHLLTERD